MTPTTSPISAPPPARSRWAFWRVACLLVGVNTVLILTTSLASEKLSFLYKDALGLDAGGAATLAIILLLPSYVRPALGALADVYPLGGFHRRSYFVAGVGLNATGYAVLAALPHFGYGPVVGCVLLSLLGVYLRLVIVEAVSVRVGNAVGRVSQLQTIQWLVPSAATILFGARLSGYVTQHWSYEACFRTAALAALLALPLVALIDERRAVHGEGTERRQSQRQDRAETRAALREGLRSQALWWVIGFVFFLQLTPKPGVVQFYYMVDALHFSKQFLGNLNAWTSAGEILGIVAFGLIAPRVAARAVVWGTIGCALLLYLPLFGLRDMASAPWVCLAGSIAGISVNLGITTLAARACPPRIEAMIFGLVLAASTLGGALSSRLGSALYAHFAGSGHDWTAGWHGLLWAGLGTALLSVVFVPLLPAWAQSREPLRGRGKVDATKTDRAETHGLEAHG